MDLNIHATIKKITLINMLGSIPHQKFCFYHLPTRGRAGIKLGDARYVSNVSIIFDCSMLYYILFWTLLGFIIHFYIIFGTNLLTGGPAQNCCFLCAYFRVSKKRNIKRSPNGMKPSGTWFLERTWSRGLGPYIKQSTRKARGRRTPLPRGFLVCCLTSTPSPLDHVCSKNHGPEDFIPFGLRLIFFFYETLK